MTSDRELMRKALIALDLWEDALTDPCADHVMRYRSFGEDAAKALRERLSQPEPEPVAWVENLTDPQPHAVTDLKYCSVAQHERGEDLKYTPLYTAPPKREWVGLTDDEVIDISKATSVYGSDNHHEVLEFVASIEAKLKEKNT